MAVRVLDQNWSVLRFFKLCSRWKRLQASYVGLHCSGHALFIPREQRLEVASGRFCWGRLASYSVQQQSQDLFHFMLVSMEPNLLPVLTSTRVLACTYRVHEMLWLNNILWSLDTAVVVSTFFSRPLIPPYATLPVFVCDSERRIPSLCSFLSPCSWQQNLSGSWIPYIPGQQLLYLDVSVERIHTYQVYTYVVPGMRFTRGGSPVELLGWSRRFVTWRWQGWGTATRTAVQPVHNSLEQ